MHLCQQNVSLDAWFATSKILHEKCDINSALNIVFQVLKDWKYGEKKLKHWIKSEKKIKSVEKIDNHIKEKKNIFENYETGFTMIIFLDARVLTLLLKTRSFTICTHTPARPNTYTHSNSHTVRLHTHSQACMLMVTHAPLCMCGHIPQVALGI